MDSRYNHARDSYYFYVSRGQKEDYLKNKITYYKKALSFFDTIQDKKLTDYRNGAKTCYSLATVYYNDCRYEDAVKYYQLGIIYLDTFEKVFDVSVEDEDYRIKLELFTNLSDAYLFLNKQDPADDAFNNFIKVLKLIKNKSVEEKNALDKNDEYKSIWQYYKKRTTYDFHLDSIKFKKNQEGLFDTHDMNFLTNGLNSIVFGSREKPDQEIPKENPFASSKPYAPGFFNSSESLWGNRSLQSDTKEEDTPVMGMDI